jgi:hypothetical protein
MSYKFKEPPLRPTFGPLPDGDYGFTVSSCDEPYYKNDHWILAVKLAIQPDGTPVFANPWSGQTSTGEERDDIAAFLVCVNRAPKVGEEPDWAKVVGARGRCRLKQEEAKMGTLAGKMVNRVAWFHAPKQVGPTAEQRPQTFGRAQVESYSPQEVEKAKADAERRAGGPVGPDLAVEPDDIPFAPCKA